MTDESTLINIGDLAEPVTTFIEKVSDAVGGVFRPHQMRRVAEAEAEIRILVAKTDIEIAELHNRAANRLLFEEAKKQANIEAITAKAIPHVKDDSKPQDLEEDWLVYFFDKARLISDDEMQNLWARVLAGEANSPGTFSRRTVTFISTIDKRDAELFTTLCRFCWHIDGFSPLIYYFESAIYLDNSINFENLEHLNTIGLISFGGAQTYGISDISEQIHYFSTPVKLEFKKDTKNELPVGMVLLTQLGKELAPLSGARPVPGFLEYVLKRWMNQGLKPSSPYPRQH